MSILNRSWWLASLTSLLLAGCQQAPVPDKGKVTIPPEATPQQKQLAESLETWNSLKTENGGHYRYETLFVSWTGFRSTTTLTVQDNEVVTRAYESSYTDDDGEEISESWTEEGAAVGSHEAGAKPRTVDELYTECQKNVLTQNAAENEFYLSFHGDDVLKACYYRSKNCADDCLRGVSADKLEFLPFKDD